MQDFLDTAAFIHGSVVDPEEWGSGGFNTHPPPFRQKICFKKGEKLNILRVEPLFENQN